MTGALRPTKGAEAVFFAAFVLACLLFWWLPSILFRFVGADDPVETRTLLISLLGLAVFVAGYALHPMRFRSAIPEWLLDTCEAWAYKATLYLGFPSLVLAVHFFLSRSGVQYGEGEGVPFVYQAVLYSHMFVAFLFLGAANARSASRCRIVIASALVILPRLVVSLRWGRFFLVQGIVPILLMAFARGWLTLTGKRALQLAGVVLLVLFGPALTRGDNFIGAEEVFTFFQAGSSLLRFQDNRDLNLAEHCPPLLVSMTAKLIPYSLLGACTVEIYGSKGMPATLDRILSKNEPANEGTLGGTGSNYLLELYLTGGISAIVLGSLGFGFSCRCFVCALGKRSLFAGIWAECLSRALFAPRSTLGYVYERIPSLVLATLTVIALVWVLYSLRDHSAQTYKGCTRSFFLQQ